MAEYTLLDVPDVLPKHPAKYSDALLPVMAYMLRGVRTILDPFAGTGKVHLLGRWLPEAEIVGVEIEPEWAAMHPKTIIGDALALDFPDGSFDAICTSPTYGNRMADSLIDGYERITYAAKLGRPLHENNSGKLQWGDKYRTFHEQAWTEARRVLRPGGLFVLNCKNHIRNGSEQFVTEWHIDALNRLGFVVIEAIHVTVPSMKFGQNADKRVAWEEVICFRLKPPLFADTPPAPKPEQAGMFAPADPLPDAAAGAGDGLGRAGG